MEANSLPSTLATIIEPSDVADALPAGVRSNMIFDKETLFFVIPEPYSVVLQASGSWGSSKARIVGYVRRPQAEPFNFVMMVAVPRLHHSDVFSKEDLAQEVDSQLPNPSASLTIFREWSGISKEKAAKIIELTPDAASLLNIVRRHDIFHNVPPETGISVKITVVIADWSAGSSESVLKNLSVIERVGGSSTIRELQLSCTILKGDVHSEKPVDSVSFTASLDALPILDSIALKDVRLTLSFSRPGGKLAPLNTTMKLTSRVILGIFDEKNPWVSVGKLTIDKASHTAVLIVAPNSQEQSMVRLGAVRLSNINFQVTYSFGKPTTLKTFLSVDVHVGERKCEGVVIFNGIRPSVLFFAMGGTVTLEELVNSISGTSFPAEYFQISLSNLRFSYSWNSSPVVLPEAPDQRQEEKRRTFEPGFNVQVRADFFDSTFDAIIRLVLTGPKKDIYISSKFLKPIDLVIISCWDLMNPASGPYFLFTVSNTNEQRVIIGGSLTIIGLIFHDVQIHSGKTVKDNLPCLSVKLDFVTSFVEGGKAPIMLEFITVKKKTHIRFNGVPLSEILNAFTGKQLMDKIKELTKKDPKAQCGEIDLPDLVENKWFMKVDFSEKQPPMEPDKPLRCSFDISGYWRIIFMPTKDIITEADMTPFALVINVPHSWGDIWKEIFAAIMGSIDEIVQHLLNNIEQFSKILTFFAGKYALESWLKAALKAWLCRHPDAPVPRLGPEPTPPPPPDTPEPPKQKPAPPPSDPVTSPGDDAGEAIRKALLEALKLLGPAASVFGKGAFRNK